MVELIFDTRESSYGSTRRAKGLIEEFDDIPKNTTKYSRLPLDEGDIKLISPTLYVVIERKTLNDMHSSKVDGRYYSQLDRLTKLRNEPRDDGRKVIVLFIFEKHRRGTKVRMTKAQYLGVKTSFNVKYDIPFIETASTADTALYILQLFKKMKMIDSSPAKTTVSARDKNLEFMSAIGEGKSRKKSTFLNPKSFLIGTLSSIPSFGPKTVAKLSGEFQSFPDLCFRIAEKVKAGDNVETWLKGFGLNKRNIANLLKYTAP